MQGSVHNNYALSVGLYQHSHAYFSDTACSMSV